MSISFIDDAIKSQLGKKRELKTFIKTQIEEYGFTQISLTYIFVTDEALWQMNKSFLNHDTYTDIITFELSKQDAELSGEIYISIDRVKENAIEYAVPYQHELHRVIFHGALHLCGFGDKTKDEKEEMRALEDEWLAGYL